MLQLRTDNAKNVALVGHLDHSSLGLGYLAAYLRAHGFGAKIINFDQGAETVYRTIRSQNPIAVGFSLIFQHDYLRYAELARYLRKRGIDCHITIGGHYPSLCYESILQDLSGLDSVVLFEGEQTLLELARRLWRSKDWRATHGIAYRRGMRVVCNKLRPLIQDLDTLPFPYRPGIPDMTLGHTMLPITATRGCAGSCSFCSVREFYARAQGCNVRRRSAQNVAAEMELLHADRNARVFIFQDDDFPLAGQSGHAWGDAFIQALNDRDLIGKVIWKISCRSNDIDPMLLARMKDAGLYFVYVGIESGTQSGLKALNRQVRVADNLRAVSILKQLGLPFGYSFMLFDPSSTFHSVKSNIRFLREIVGDGSAAVVYCKMLLYTGTPIGKALANSGRLSGSRHQPDYRLVQPELDACYDRLYDLLADWIHEPHGVSRHLNLLWHELAIIKALPPKLEGTLQYESRLRINTWKCNQIILDLLQTTLSAYENGDHTTPTTDELKHHAKAVIDQLLEMRNLYIHTNRDRLMSALAESRSVCAASV